MAPSCSGAYYPSEVFSLIELLNPSSMSKTSPIVDFAGAIYKAGCDGFVLVCLIKAA